MDANRTKLCVEGYIRVYLYTQAKYDKEIPNELIDIIILLCGQFEINYVGHFSKENASYYGIKIQSDKLTIRGYRSAKLDQPLPVSLKNKNIKQTWRWRAKTSKKNIINSQYCEYLIFGVVSNQCSNFEDFPCKSLVDTYGISAKQKYVFNGTSNLIKNVKAQKGFKAYNKIRMEYTISSGDQCTLSFYNESLNDSFIYSMELPKSEKITGWYPVFSQPYTTTGMDGGYTKVIPYSHS